MISCAQFLGAEDHLWTVLKVILVYDYYYDIGGCLHTFARGFRCFQTFPMKSIAIEGYQAHGKDPVTHC